MDSLHEFINLKVQVIEKINELQEFIDNGELSDKDRVHYKGILEELNVGVERLVLSVLMEIGETTLGAEFLDFEDEDPLEDFDDDFEDLDDSEDNVYDFESHKRQRDKKDN